MKLALWTAILGICFLPALWGQEEELFPKPEQLPKPGELGLGDLEIEKTLLDWTAGIRLPGEAIQNAAGERFKEEFTTNLAKSSNPDYEGAGLRYFSLVKLTIFCTYHHTQDAAIHPQIYQTNKETLEAIYDFVDPDKPTPEYPRELRLITRLFPSIYLGKSEYTAILDELAAKSPILERVAVRILNDGQRARFEKATIEEKRALVADPRTRDIEKQLMTRWKRLEEKYASSSALGWLSAMDHRMMAALVWQAGWGWVGRVKVMADEPEARPADSPKRDLPKQFGGLNGFDKPQVLAHEEIMKQVAAPWMDLSTRPLSGSRKIVRQSFGYYTMEDCLFQIEKVPPPLGGPDLRTAPMYYYCIDTQVETVNPPEKGGFTGEQVVFSYDSAGGRWNVNSWCHN